MSLFEYDEVKKAHAESRGYRDFFKGLFTVLTFGLGGLYLWATTLVIREGEIGIRRKYDGTLELLPPGRHSNFPWEDYPFEPVALDAQKLIDFGPYKIVTVDTGEVRECYIKGKLTILEPHSYIFNDPLLTIGRSLSTKIKTDKLDTIEASTLDNVPLSINADICYRVYDAHLAISNIDKINSTLGELAKMALCPAIAQHRLQDFIPATNSMSNIKSDLITGLNALIERFKHDFIGRMAEFGIELRNIGITSCVYQSPELTHELAQGAVKNALTANELANAENEAKIMYIKANAKAETKKIKAEAKAQALTIQGNAILKIGEQLADHPAALQIYNNQQRIDMVGNNPVTFFFNEGSNNPLPLPVLSVTSSQGMKG